ncbi:MAG: NlpC/P60 family protein [Pseudomonadota bacterium]
MIDSQAERVVAVARRWIGTPYHHQASREQVGTDCLGLVRGIWREVIGPEPERVPAYSPHWAETGRVEALLVAARRRMAEIDPAEAAPGDILAFRMREKGIAKHVGILVTGDCRSGRIVHAYEGHAVCETAIGPSWARRLAGAFRFPKGR